MSLSLLDQFWYRRNPLCWLMYPLSLLYQVVNKFRRAYLHKFHQQNFPIPILVVGNLTVGGVGKTPLVIALAKALQARGLQVGIVSRGYKATIHQFPHEICDKDVAALVGDEPLLLAKKTGCPVVIAPKRVQAVQYLLEKYACQIIISDDGLQHYALGRAIEIVVIDGSRGLGNGFCLPAGPLREGKKRLQQADLLVVNGGEWPQAFRMDFVPGQLTSLTSGAQVEPGDMQGLVAAVAAIGNPQRFFTTLRQLGICFKAYPFVDHHAYKPQDLVFEEKIVVMTEKDAVKCLPFATDKMYFLPVEAKLGNEFWDALWSHECLQDYLKSIKSNGVC